MVTGITFFLSLEAPLLILYLIIFYNVELLIYPCNLYLVSLQASMAPRSQMKRGISSQQCLLLSDNEHQECCKSNHGNTDAGQMLPSNCCLETAVILTFFILKTADLKTVFLFLYFFNSLKTLQTCDWSEVVSSSFKHYKNVTEVVITSFKQLCYDLKLLGKMVDINEYLFHINFALGFLCKTGVKEELTLKTDLQKNRVNVCEKFYSVRKNRQNMVIWNKS